MNSKAHPVPAPVLARLRAAGERIRAANTTFAERPLLQQASLLTLPLLLLYTPDYWYVQVLLGILVVAGLIFCECTNSPAFWFAAAAILAVALLKQWHVLDNHQYLILYWCLAIGVAAFYPHRPEVLIRSARYLIGLAFLFATGWKLVTPDFMTGDFLHYCFLFDSRFSEKLQFFQLLPADMAEFNHWSRQALISYDSQFSEVAIHTSGRLHLLALALAWYTILIEGLIALSFLSPPGSRLGRFRHLLLLLFIVTIYPVAPVAGFGWVLLAMGFVQCEPEHSKTRMAYLGALLLIQLVRIPWTTL